MLLANGKYLAVVKDVSLFLRGDNGRLTAAFRLECQGKELVHREWIELNDGSLSDKTVKRLRQCFPDWDGTIETLEQGFCVKDVEVEVTVENEADRQDPEKWWTRTKFMDPPGGGSGGTAALPERESRATLVSKYGARFRALAGGKEGEFEQKGAKETKAGGPAPSRPPATRPPKAPEAPGPASSLEECWEAMCKKHPDELREPLSERWFEMLERVVPGKDQAEFGAEDWGRVLAVIAAPC